MNLRQLFERGRIVPGVNTTPDVGPNEIKKQAAKFGFKVDKDGRPQNHPSKVKGSKTNVLFNLGMTESKDSALHISQALQLEKKAEAIWQRSVGRQFPWKSTEQKLIHIGKVIQAGQDPKKFIKDLNMFYNKYISFIQKNKLPTELIRLLKQIQKLLVKDNLKDLEEGNLFKNPKNTFLTKADTAYDFIKVGTNLANLKSMPAGSNMDEPDIMISPYAGAKEMKYLMKQLNRIGYKTQDAQGYQDAHFDDKPTGGEAPPQMKAQGPLGKIKISKLRGVQKERTYEKLAKQLERVLEDDYAPLQIDRRGRVINGHHRLDALRLVGEEYARVHMIDDIVENIKENFAYNEAFVKPQFDVEWGEATRYPEFKKLGKKEWIKLAKKGKAVTIKNAKDINNTDAADPASFKSLDKNKQARALAQLKSGDVEMPIVAVYSDGYKELIGGNTRLTAMIAQNGKATVWQFEVPDEVAELAENFADGKKKGKSRPGRVKKSGASCKGSVTSLRAKAKKSSGERAKMYHWCANMKSGRKKK